MRSRRCTLVAAALFMCTLGLFTACSGGEGSPSAPASCLDGGGSGDANGNADADATPGPPPDGSFLPAIHAELPRVENRGGPVLDAPVVVPVFFANDSMQAQIEQFLTQLAGSAYWSATTGEYGAGALQVAPSIVLPDAAPDAVTDVQIQATLAGYLDGTHPEWPTLDKNHVVVVFYPQNTVVTTSNGDTSCVAFGGYHSEGFLVASDEGGGADSGVEDATSAEAGNGTSDDGSTVDAEGAANAASDAGPPQDGASAALNAFVYVVVPRCASFNGLEGINSLTVATSHELVETATDPLPATSPAFESVDFEHFAWNYHGTAPFGSELADLCLAAEARERLFQPMVGTFLVQRTWSNQAAEADEDPCVPPIPDPYFSAVPDLDSTLNPPYPDHPSVHFLTTGVFVPVGESRTVDLRLFSTGPVADWYLGGKEYTADGGRTMAFSFDKPSGNNGDVIHLKLTRVSPGSLPGGYSEMSFASSATALPFDGGVQQWSFFVGP